jgi:Zn-dependent peptidase ImmA (M78 family)/transcriptional regulator with XRE-family HTH domain
MTTVTSINPPILRWARERAGLSIADAASCVKKEVAILEAWESGEAAPTYNQLETLAYKVYKLPLAVFYFPEPPKEADPNQSFRTLPKAERDALEPNTRFLVRKAASMQLALAELNDGKNPAEKNIVKNIRLSETSNIGAAVRDIRSFLDVTVEQQKSWKSSDDALSRWREKIQDAGVYVFKAPFKQRGLCGFCLSDSEFPIIYLNNYDSKNRQIFTLFHELAHLLFDVSGVTKESQDYITALGIHEQNIEVMCNALAAQVIVPEDDFNEQIKEVKTVGDDLIQRLTTRYKVSGEVVLRKFFDRGMVSKAYYKEKVALWNRQYLVKKEEEKAKQKEQEGGPSYSVVQVSYLGTKYLSEVFNQYYRGRIDATQASDYLGVKVKSFAGIEHKFIEKMRAEM